MYNKVQGEPKPWELTRDLENRKLEKETRLSTHPRTINCTNRTIQKPSQRKQSKILY